MKSSIIACLALLLASNIAFCQATGPRKGNIYQIGDNNDYCAAIETSIFAPYRAAQNYDNWCWAACIQMVLNYQGIKVDQSDIVVKAFGEIINQPADCGIMTHAADGWQYNGITISSWQERDVSVLTFIDALANKYPMVIGLNMPGQNVGHAYVLTAVFFQFDGNYRKIPYKVVLRDPWPFNPSRKELAWNDFISRINCVVHFTQR